MGLKDRLQKRWNHYQQARSLRHAGVPEVRRYPEKFDLAPQRARQMVQVAIQAIKDIETAREQIALIYKVSRATNGLPRKQLSRLLDAYLPHLRKPPVEERPNEWDELLYQLPALRPRHLRRLLAVLSIWLNRERAHRPSRFYFARLLDHSNCDDATLEAIVDVLKRYPAHYSSLVKDFAALRQHPDMQQALLATGDVHHIAPLLQSSDPTIWMAAFDELIRLNPIVAAQHLRQAPLPDELTLSHEDLMPLLTHEQPSVRQAAVRTLSRVSAEPPTRPLRPPPSRG